MQMVIFTICFAIFIFIMMKIFLTVFLFFLTTNSLGSEQIQQDSKKLQKNIIDKIEKWTIIKAKPNDTNVCYAILYSNPRVGNQKKTDEKPYLMVHYFSHKKMRFSLYFGYKIIEKQKINISIDSIPYKIQPLQEYGIAQDFKQEMQILEHIKTGKKLLARGEGKNFVYSVDEYDISGFLDVLKVMEKKCSFHSDESSFKTITPQKEHLLKFSKK